MICSSFKIVLQSCTTRGFPCVICVVPVNPLIFIPGYRASNSARRWSALHLHFYCLACTAFAKCVVGGVGKLASLTLLAKGAWRCVLYPLNFLQVAPRFFWGLLRTPLFWECILIIVEYWYFCMKVDMHRDYIYHLSINV